jgi:hypothetical protein
MSAAREAKMSKNLQVECPCCATQLVVDAKTGEIISHERPAVDHEANFDKAMSEVRESAQKRSDAFQNAFQKTQDLGDLLDRKFEEAKKKAAKDTGKRHNPLDFD